MNYNRHPRDLQAFFIELYTFGFHNWSEPCGTCIMFLISVLRKMTLEDKHKMQKIKIKGLLILGLLLLLPSLAAAKEAEDITARCAFSSPKSKYGVARLTDGLTDKVWKSKRMKTPYIEIELPKGETCSGLSIQWGELNPRWEIQTLRDGKWERERDGNHDYLTTYTDLDGLTHFRIAAPGRVAGTLVMNEITVFGQGEKPAYVQDWQPTPKKADLLLLVAHPDDEFVFMGGIIPYYAVERGKNVVVAYVTESSYQRRSELLNGLWAVGLRTYPVIGRFHDRFTYDIKAAYQKLGYKKTHEFAVELLRKYKPDVVVTHDLHGEYGHAVHKVSADLMTFACEAAADPKQYANLLQDGTWNVPKLYLHLYPERAMEMDWHRPLAAFGGKTALDMARIGFSYHLSQQRTVYKVYDGGEYDCGSFGLYRTLVGDDVRKDDFFENITGVVSP